MKIYKTQSEVEADIKNGVLAIEGDVKFECNISIEASIIVTNGDINAWNINARDITAWDINARNITAFDITACDITACYLNAGNITAGNISYYGFCCAYQSIKCTSIKSRRQKAQEPICLDGKLEIKPKEDEDVERAIKLLEEKGRLKDGKILS